jgi:hypothetical protein
MEQTCSVSFVKVLMSGPIAAAGSETASVAADPPPARVPVLIVGGSVVGLVRPDHVIAWRTPHAASDPITALEAATRRALGADRQREP